MRTVISLENYQQHREYVGAVEQALEQQVGFAPAGLQNSLELHVLYFRGIVAPSSLSPGSVLVDELAKLSLTPQDLLLKVHDLTDERAGWISLGWDVMDKILRLHRGFGDADQPLNFIPILALDLFEHAYWLDYGRDVHSYVEAYLTSLDWQHVEQLLQAVRKCRVIFQES